MTSANKGYLSRKQKHAEATILYEVSFPVNHAIMFNLILNTKPALTACSLLWDHCQNKEQLQNVPPVPNSDLQSDADVMQRSKREICTVESEFLPFCLMTQESWNRFKSFL